MFSVFLFAVAAFEPLCESPWLSGGVAAALFPQTRLSIPLNPSSIGLLEGSSLAVSASRPFGFRELDRTAFAGGHTGGRYSVAGFGSYSGRNGYSEATFTAAGAMNLFPLVIGGLSLSFHQLGIEGYGNTGCFSGDAGITARPVRGLFLGASCRGLFSTSPTPGGKGVVPRTLSAAAGISPVEGVTVAAGASIHQYCGEEYSLVTSVSPFPGVSLSASIQSPPVRMGLSVGISVSPVTLQYGYTTHTELPSGHSACLSWGNSGFVPVPMGFEEGRAEPPGVSFPLNINTATEEELQNIPGIGPSKASTIRSWVDDHGPVESLDQLVNVPGIGPSTLERIMPYLTV